MSQAARNLFMFTALVYLFLIYLCWQHLLRNRSSLNIESIGWYLLIGFNASAILFLTVKGLPMFIDGAMPSPKIFLIAVLFSGFLLFNRVEILGNIVIDTLVVSCLLVCLASVLPLGILQFIREPIDLENLIIHWTISSLIVAIFSRVYVWLTNRG